MVAIAPVARRRGAAACPESTMRSAIWVKISVSVGLKNRPLASPVAHVAKAGRARSSARVASDAEAVASRKKPRRVVRGKSVTRGFMGARVAWYHPCARSSIRSRENSADQARKIFWSGAARCTEREVDGIVGIPKENRAAAELFAPRSIHDRREAFSGVCQVQRKPRAEREFHGLDRSRGGCAVAWAELARDEGEVRRNDRECGHRWVCPAQEREGSPGCPRETGGRGRQNVGHEDADGPGAQLGEAETEHKPGKRPAAAHRDIDLLGLWQRTGAHLLGQLQPGGHKAEIPPCRRPSGRHEERPITAKQ